MRSGVLFCEVRGALVVALCAGAAFSCGPAVAGQSFDDGSGDVGRGHARAAVDGRKTLAQQPSMNIQDMQSNYPVDGTSGFVGDIDQDGCSDFALISLLGDTSELAAYVFYGRPQFPSELELSDADFVITGVQGNLAPIGDFNGDGFDDLAFSGWQGSRRRLNVLLGGERRSGELASSSLESSFAGGVPGTPLDSLVGFSGAGDMNGDGFDDVLVWGKWVGVLPGRAEPYGQTLASANVAMLEFPAVASALHVGMQGDWDGDGFADLLLSSNSATQLYYGRARGFVASLNPVAPDAVFSQPVRALGDWDGDGYGDLAQIGAWAQYRGGDPEDELQGLNYEIRISYGSAQRFQGSIALDDVAHPDPAKGSFYPEDPVLALGDMNGDRHSDLVIGSPRSPLDQREGAGAVFFVRGGKRQRALALSPSDAPLHGRIQQPTTDRFGRGISANGDVNGDGYADVLIARNQTFANPAGMLLVFGGPGL